MKNITKTKFSCQRDGLTIRGYEYRPQGEKLPIAIVSHGFMANLMTVKHYAEFLAEMGYASFCYDFCGGCVMMGKSDGKTTDMSVLTEVRDLSAVIEYAKRLDYTDSSNILLMGCSQGGFVSALTAAKLKDEIKKLVLFYPALCIPDDARSGKMMWAKFDPKNIPETVKCGPMKLGRCYIADVVDMNPFDEIKGYFGDVLIVHGTADKIVARKYADEAKRTYQARSVGTVALHYIEDTDRTALAAGGFDAAAEFAEGKAVFYANGNWEWSGLSEKGMKAEDLTMIPYYCGVEGEEKAGLNCGTENYWAVNSQASEADINATLEFMNWLVTDAEASEKAVGTFGVMPYKNAAESTNPFLAQANAYASAGNYTMPWVTNFQPNVDEYRKAIVGAMNTYNSDPTDANWELVTAAFVDGWATQYAAVNG